MSKARPPKEAIAVFTLMKNPGLSIAELARAAGCHRGSVYRMPMVMKIFRIQSEQSRRERAERDCPVPIYDRETERVIGQDKAVDPARDEQ